MNRRVTKITAWAVVGILMAYFVVSGVLNFRRSFYSVEQTVVSVPKVIPSSGRLDIPLKQPLHRVHNVAFLHLFIDLKDGAHIDFADSESGIKSTKGKRVNIDVYGVALDGHEFRCVPSGWNANELFMQFTDLPVGVAMSQLVIASPDLKQINRLVWHEAANK